MWEIIVKMWFPKDEASDHSICKADGWNVSIQGKVGEEGGQGEEKGAKEKGASSGGRESCVLTM